jgi:hypothetical protein
MREIKDHIIIDSLVNLKIEVADDAGAGGANHAYLVSNFDLSTNKSAGDGVVQNASTCQVIYFQNGTIPENGMNGLTHEVLLAIVSDRLRSFQAGQFACKANACALAHIEEAMHWLQQRTIERMRRGVEGTHTI